LRFIRPEWRRAARRSFFLSSLWERGDVAAFLLSKAEQFEGGNVEVEEVHEWK
jgi:hypothetical protein